MTLPPIRRSVSVSWSPEAAFRRFTADFATWWPYRSHSAATACAASNSSRTSVAVFTSTKMDADSNGDRSSLGSRRAKSRSLGIRRAIPRPRKTWSSSSSPRDTGTRVGLTAGGWERWGEHAERAHRGYSVGWAYILDVWTTRRTARRAALGAIGAIIGIVQKFRGGVDAKIARAGGEMPRT